MFDHTDSVCQPIKELDFHQSSANSLVPEVINIKPLPMISIHYSANR